MRKTILSLLTLAPLLMPASAAHAGETDAEAPESVLDFTMTDIEGEDVDLGRYRGHVLLLVNVASKCGLTPQYEQLTTLDGKYREQGLRILGFPANNFMGQEPGSDEQILTFCQTNYGVEFDMFSKISVKGKDIHPLYAYLTSKDAHPETGGKIQWNFTKFLVGRDGTVIARFGPRTAPDAPEVVEAIEAALAKEAGSGAQ